MFSLICFLKYFLFKNILKVIFLKYKHKCTLSKFLFSTENDFLFKMSLGFQLITDGI
jgi:hypothetical protein